MKKVLALVLATVMALGMTTVAFAATTYYTMDITAIDRTTLYSDDDGKIDAAVANGVALTPGKTYYMLVNAYKDSNAAATTSSAATTKLSDLGNYKISYSIDDGKNMIESVKFVSTKWKSNSNKQLAIAIKIKDNFITESQDVNMTIKITSKSTVATIQSKTGDINSSYNYLDLLITESAFYDENGGNDVENGYFSVVKGGAVLTFSEDADDVTLIYEKDVEVQGDMRGQKKIVTRLDTSNAAIEDKYADATVRFFAGDKDTFRRDVTVTMPYDASSETPYLYVVDAKGNLTKLVGGSNADKAANETGAKYDENIGAFVFKTKTLGNYVISDTELKSTSVDAPVDTPVEGEQPSEGNEPNPGTGANDFVGLAVAMAVVSLAGIAVAKRK